MSLSPSGFLLAFLAAGAAGPPGPAKLDEPALARRIDARVADGWKSRGVVPAPRADDAEFVRRVYLDLSGRMPDLLEARDFIDNPDSEKRAKLIDRLLADPRYAVHFAEVWRGWWMPETLVNRFGAPAFEQWLRDELKGNVGYNKMVRALIDGTSDTRNNAAALFRQAHGTEPENMAAATSRLFLGVRLECAQCHNHPFARWKRTQFWELAAFFKTDRLAGRAAPPGTGGATLVIPGTDKTVSATFLDGRPLRKDGGEATSQLGEWATSPNNPFFARAGVNRVWEYLLGTGLVDPVDEASPDNPPSHPELLDELAGQFVAHEFDLKYLLRAVLLSQAYQRTSRQTHPGQADARLFARMRVRGLSPAQLYDSLAVVTGKTESDAAYDPRTMIPNSPRAQFLQRFPNQDRRTEQKTSILQALYLMNGQLVGELTTPEGANENLDIIAASTGVRPARQIEQLFLVTLSRKPTPEEAGRILKYVEKGGPTGDRRRALCDLLWALLNTSEFAVNH